MIVQITGPIRHEGWAGIHCRDCIFKHAPGFIGIAGKAEGWQYYNSGRVRK